MKRLIQTLGVKSARFAKYASFTAWTDKVNYASLTRNMLRKRVRRLQRTAQHALFSTWQYYVSNKNRVADVLCSLLKRRGRGLLFQTVSVWNDAAGNAKCNRKLMYFLLGRLKKVWLLRIFAIWESRGAENKSTRHSQMVKVSQKRLDATQIHIFTVWMLLIEAIEQETAIWERWSLQVLRLANNRGVVANLCKLAMQVCILCTRKRANLIYLPCTPHVHLMYTSCTPDVHLMYT